MVIILSFVAGGLVNPIESGTDYYFNQPIIEETSAIVSQDPNATWIISGNIYIDEIIGVGAHTLNSVNTYPNFETWQKLDPNNESYEIYNRYAHIPIVLVNNQPTTFISGDAQEMFTLYLNTYPILGGLMTQYAAVAGKIPITLIRKNDVFDI